MCSEEHQELVIEVMREHRSSLKSPPKTEVEYLDGLVLQKLIRAVAMVRDTGERV